jgi:hypothetical protein
VKPDAGSDAISPARPEAGPDVGLDALLHTPNASIEAAAEIVLQAADFVLLAEGVVPDAVRNALREGIVDENPVAPTRQDGHLLQRPIQPVDVTWRHMPHRLISLP